MTEQLTDYDSPWKEIIELYFPRFLEFFFTQAYAEIDWTRPYVFTTIVFPIIYTWSFLSMRKS